MRRLTSIHRRAALCGLICIITAGCGGGGQAPLSESAVMNDNLKGVGSLYRTYQSLQHKAPTKVADLKAYQDMAPAAFEALRSGAVEVVWGTSLTDLEEDSSKDSPDEVLAYEKKTPTEGGAALMKNRTVKTLTADEFKAAPKAGKS